VQFLAVAIELGITDAWGFTPLNKLGMQVMLEQTVPYDLGFCGSGRV
jgi:hypothetical protein